jgi:hypothetical protein
MRIMFGKKCGCHNVIMNTTNLMDVHNVKIDLVKLLRDYDKGDKKTRRRTELEFKLLQGTVTTLAKN